MCLSLLAPFCVQAEEHWYNFDHLTLHAGTYIHYDPDDDHAGNRLFTSLEAVKSNNPYIEEAKKECTYEKPRRIGSAVGSHAALNREKEKSAQQEYERCLARKAHELKKAQQK